MTGINCEYCCFPASQRSKCPGLTDPKYCQGCKLLYERKIQPPLINRIVNLTGSVIDHAMDRFRQVPSGIFQERMDVCRQCEFAQEGKCLQCGCLLNIKLSWASERCPIDKWAEYTEEKKAPQGGCGCGAAPQA
jgi:hypothetical protein